MANGNKKQIELGVRETVYGEVKALARISH